MKKIIFAKIKMNIIDYANTYSDICQAIDFRTIRFCVFPIDRQRNGYCRP
jgi:hypothetical protein